MTEKESELMAEYNRALEENAEALKIEEEENISLDEWTDALNHSHYTAGVMDGLSKASRILTGKSLPLKE